MTVTCFLYNLWAGTRFVDVIRCCSWDRFCSKGKPSFRVERTGGMTNQSAELEARAAVLMALLDSKLELKLDSVWDGERVCANNAPDPESADRCCPHTWMERPQPGHRTIRKVSCRCWRRRRRSETGANETIVSMQENGRHEGWNAQDCEAVQAYE